MAVALNKARVELDLSGLKNLQKNASKRLVARKAVTKMARVCSPTVRAMAPKREGPGGTLKRAIGVKSGNSRKFATGAFAVVGARRKIEASVTIPPRIVFFQGKDGKPGHYVAFPARPGTRVVPANYLHLVAFGTRPHTLGSGDTLARVGRGGLTRGSTRQLGQIRHPGAKANNFVRRAWDAKKAEAMAAGMNTLSIELRTQIAKEHARIMAKLRK